MRRAADDVLVERGVVVERGVDCGVMEDAGVLGVLGRTGGAVGVFAGACEGGGGVWCVAAVVEAGEGVGMAGAEDGDDDVERALRGFVLRLVYSSIA